MKKTPKNLKVDINGIKQKIEKNVSDRETSIIIGTALLLMAVLSGIAFSSLGTLTASIFLVFIFVLDVLVSLNIYRYYKDNKFSKIVSLLRLIYTLIFGIGIGYHFFNNITMFKSFFGAGLIVFGIHLISLGILYNNQGGNKWINIFIKTALIVAGIGYMVLNIGSLIVANPLTFTMAVQPIFIIPMILGEISFALWILIKGGKSKKIKD
jgi:hypothetical protein